MPTYKSGILGVSNAGSAPPLQTLRKYGRSDKIWMRALADAPMLHLMTSRLNKQGKGDVKYYMTEDDYYVQSGTLKGCTSAGANAALTTALTHVYVTGDGSVPARSFLRVGDVIHVPAFQTNQTATWGTGDGSTDGTVQMAGEDLIVRAIVSDYVVQVDRNGGAGTATGGVTAASGNTLKWEIKGNALPDGSASPTAVADALEEDYNYREVIRLPWNVSARSLMQDLYGIPDIQRLAIKNRTQFFRNLERKFWTNHRYIKYGSNGLEESHTGGLIEWIVDTASTGTRIQGYDASADLVMGDGTQRVWMVNKNFDLSHWNQFMEKALKYYSKNKVGVGGRGFLTNLEDTLRPYYGSFDWDVDTFGFGVIMAKNSFGRLPIAVEEEWSNGAAGYDYCYAVVDMANIGYVYGEGPCAIKGCGNQNSDLHVHTNIQANDEAHRKDELFADIGFWQTVRKSHSMLFWDGTK